MKNSIVLALFSLVTANIAVADQKATLKCVGENVILEEKSPYLGDSSEFNQSLYVLKSTGRIR